MLKTGKISWKLFLEEIFAWLHGAMNNNAKLMLRRDQRKNQLKQWKKVMEMKFFSPVQPRHSASHTTNPNSRKAHAASTVESQPRLLHFGVEVIEHRFNKYIKRNI